MQMILPIEQSPYLPNMPTKKELAFYFGYAKTESLYTSIITFDRIQRVNEKLGVQLLKLDLIRSMHCKRLPKPLADIIYLEENIISL